MKLLRAATAICALTAGLGGTASAGTHVETGDTTGSANTMDMTAFYNGAGTAVPYQAISFEVDRPSEYTFMAVADFEVSLKLYQESFNPASGLTSLIWQDTNLISPETAGFISFLMPGTRYIAVISGVDDDDFGTYSYHILGGGNINVLAVPEPSTWLMLAGGLGLLGLARRRVTTR